MKKTSQFSQLRGFFIQTSFFQHQIGQFPEAVDSLAIIKNIPAVEQHRIHTKSCGSVQVSFPIINVDTIRSRTAEFFQRQFKNACIGLLKFQVTTDADDVEIPVDVKFPAKIAAPTAGIIGDDRQLAIPLNSG